MVEIETETLSSLMYKIKTVLFSLHGVLEDWRRGKKKYVPYSQVD